MTKHLKRLKGKLYDEEISYRDLSAMLKKAGLPNHSIGYISDRMAGKRHWDTEEMYALADILHIPDDEILSYFPRKQKASAPRQLKVV